MEKMVIAFVLIALAAVVMFVKWPASAFGYVYCVAVGLMMAGAFLYPFTSTTYEVMHCMTLGGGIGAVAGLLYAISIKTSGATLGVIIGGAILFPILMFIVGFIIVFALGIMLMFQNGSAAEVVTAGLVTWGLIAAIIGSVGSVLIIIIDG